MKCVICKKELIGNEHNAEPVKVGTCCDACNIIKVLPERMKQMREQQGEKK